MGALVCPDCRAPTLSERGEVEVHAWRSWTGTIRPTDGVMDIKVGKTDHEPPVSMFLSGGWLDCSCGWCGRPEQLTQIGWDGLPVRRPIDGQLALLAAVD